MRSGSEHMQKRGKNGIWYVRLRVPTDLVKAFGREEFIKSLKTSDERTARKLARQTVVEWERQFELARRKPDLSGADIETLARSYYVEQQQADLEKRNQMPLARDREALEQSARARLTAIQRDVPASQNERLRLLDNALDDLAALRFEDLTREARNVRLNELREHLARREYALITHEADALIKREDLPIEDGSEEYVTLCDRLMRAEIELLTRMNERDAGDYTGQTLDPMLGKGLKRLDLTTFEKIIDEQERKSMRGIGSKKAPSTFRKYRSITQEFTDWRRSTRASSVTTEEVERWRDELADMDFSAKTVHDKISCIKAVLNWGQRQSNGALFPNHPPLHLLEKLELEEQDSALRTYTVEQAERVLLEARKCNVAYQRWVPWLLAYSGARVNEILQLTKEDFFQVGSDWFYHIRHGGERTTKTKRSRRVPVHPALVDEGLIDFVMSCPAGKLFREKRMDGNLRDWIREKVLPDLPEPKPGPNHGFRHLFEDLRLGAIESDASKYITGRADKNSAAKYGKSMAMLPALAREMAKFPRFLTK